MINKKKNASKCNPRSAPVPDKILDQMIEEAIIDAYGESEQTTCFYTMIEDNLAMPFETEILRIKVTVKRIDMTDDDQIVAVCARGNSHQRVPILELPILYPPPKGAEWIEAYRRWTRGKLQ